MASPMPLLPKKGTCQMSDTASLQATIGHNRPTITPPSGADWLAELQRRYPEVATRLAAFEKAAAEYPDEITLDQPDVAEALQDLLSQMNKESGVWEAWSKNERAPWKSIVDITSNFFSKPLDVIGEKETAKRIGTGLIGKLGKVYKAYLDKKEAEQRKRIEAEIEAQRRESERLQAEAIAAEAKRKEADRLAQEAADREAEARRKEEEAKLRRAEEERKAELAAAEQKRIEAESKAKVAAELEEFTTIMMTVKPLLKRAADLHALTESDEAKQGEVEYLEELVRVGGTISTLAAPLNRMVYLNDDEIAKVTSLRSTLTELRAGVEARATRATKRRLEAKRLEEEKQAAVERAERQRQREADEAASAKAKAERAEAEAASEKAKTDAAAARAEITDAKGAKREAAAVAREAGKDERSLSQAADQAENRADRQEARAERAAPADFNRTRGDMGSTGGTVRRWTPIIQDIDALRDSMGPLGPHVLEEAISNAVTNFIRVHQSGFEGERVEGMLPGVTFTYEKDFAIR
jgi:hypothetical protein